MSQDKNPHREKKKGRGQPLTKVLRLIPLFELVLHILEFILKLCGIK